jgi:branched-chain amino acid transport system permease protein
MAYILDTAVYVGLFSLLAMSLNLEYGFTGLLNFGKVAFFMIGAYVSAMLTISGAPYPVGLLGGMTASALAGLLMSLPALRLREDYLAIVMLVFGEVIRIILKNEIWIAGGPFGLTGIPPALPLLRGIETEELYIAINVVIIYGILLVTYVLLEMLVNSPFGRVLRGIREDEVATRCFGKNTLRYKAQIFAIGSAIAGIAGSLYAQYVGYTCTRMFMPIVTFTAMVMCILGGVANNRGSILGALIMIGLERGTRIAKDYLSLPIDPSNMMYILTGSLIVVFLLSRPSGVLKENPVKSRRSKKGRA